MKKLIAVGIMFILAIGLAGCSWFQPAVEDTTIEPTTEMTETKEAVDSEYFTQTSESTVNINSENLSLTFKDNFEISENIIQFGPGAHIPESPTDKEYIRPSYRLTVVDQKSFDEILKIAEENPDIAFAPTSEKINNLNVAKWVQGGLCEYDYFEIIGKNNNILIQSQSCENLDHEKYLTDFINNIK